MTATPSRLIDFGIAVAATLFFASAALAQSPEASPAPATQPAGVRYALHPLAVKLLAAHWSDMAAQEYNLDARQKQAFRRQITESWTNFIDDNRSQIEPLLGEFERARHADTPPSAEQVAHWAARALPLFEKARGELGDGQAGLREILTPRQRLLFDARTARSAASMLKYQRTLKRWSTGSFRDDEWWQPADTNGLAEESAASASEGQRRPEPVLERQASPAHQAAPTARQPAPAESFGPDIPQRIGEELTAWEQYVAAFCDHYELDRSQRNTADSILREMIARAVDHIHLHRDEVAKLERMISGTDPQAARNADQDDVNAEIERLYGPIDQMFAELQQRIQLLPTAAQRARADQQPPDQAP